MALGDLQYLTMLAVARLGDDAVSRRIGEVLSDVAGRDVSVSTVFVTLTRLEDQGLVHSVRGDHPERGGRAARVFSLSEQGWEAVRQTRMVSDRMWEGVEGA